ncbi:hypothetical protein AB0C07_28640 [Actinoplanes missouriensis]|uniref:hypothetical protein n=1 Tax=Actinoplanes missouriensis TaxID=1866 RepID=UPI00340019B5
MASASYGRAVGLAALQAVLSSTWIAARELSPAKRRLARLGTVAAVAAVGWVAAPKDAPDSDSDDQIGPAVGANPYLAAEGAASPDDASQPDSEPPFDKRKAALVAGGIGIGVAAMAGRRQLEKRWLARLTRNGHPHPTRALAVRMAGVEFVGQLAMQLNDVRKARSKAGR